ncbi:uncharacterized protein ACN63O_020093 [Diretmus argenteus]
MAQQGIQLDWDNFCCSICLDLLKDPVTIPCGHSYCMSCIKGCWDEEDQKNVHSCPQCRQTFTPRPVLVKNTMFAAVVEDLKKTGLQAAPPDHCYAGPGDVACDICTGRKLKALKSCLVCLASYCERHLQGHYDAAPLKKHQLVNPRKTLQENICSRHNEVMKVFCRTDQQCICYLCSMEEHKDHDTVSAAAERNQRQKELGVSLQNIQQMIQDRERDMKVLQQRVEAINCSADKAVEHSEKIFTEVKQQIRSRQKAEVHQAEELQKKMEQKIVELRRKVTEVQQLSHTEDNTHFLQNSSSLSGLSESTDLPTDVRPPRCFADVSVAVSEVRDKVEGILKEEGSKISLTVTEDVLLSRPEPNSRDEFLQYSRQIKLDPNTAHTHLLLSEGNRKARAGLTVQLYPRHLDRFIRCLQVLSREDLTGRCYWEVEWTGLVSIAVSHKNISRTGTSDECVFGRNDKSWSLDCFNNSYQFTHNKISTPAPGPQSSRVGVYLDHRAGILSFYSVSGTMMTLLHRVQTSFTQTLYAGFRLNCSAFNTIIPQQLVEKLRLLKVNNSICNWVFNFLTQRQQTVRVGSRTSKSMTMSMGSPQGCVLNPLLFSLLTHDCTARSSSNHIVKFADDTAVVCLIKDNDESAYREEVRQLTTWCKHHNLSLNVDKTREMVIDFRRDHNKQHTPLLIDGTAVERASSVKYLRVHIADDLTPSTNTIAVTKKVQHWLHSLRRLRKTGIPTSHLNTFYRGTVESILTYSFTSCEMAQQRIQLDRDNFCCSICLDLLKDPVTIPCGHSYCMGCIKDCWDEEDQKNVHSCPQCRQTFTPRPVLVKNTMFAALVEDLKKTGLQAAPPDHCYAGPGDVACDICTGRKLKALKSCLVCLASYCERHLQHHYDAAPLKKHQLVNPRKTLQENICSRHNEVMKVFCRTDQQCICYLCSMDEHKDHDTVSAAAERNQRQKELSVGLQNIQQMIQDREKDVKVLQQWVKAINSSADNAVEHSEKTFTEVKQQIRSRQKAEVHQAEELQKKMEQKIVELRRKVTEVQQLSHTEDNAHFLQDSSSLSGLSESTDLPTDVWSPRCFEDVSVAVSEVRDKVEGILKEEGSKISLTVTEDVLLSRPEPKTRDEFLQYSRQITLDPNTAPALVLLSEGNKKATTVFTDQFYPDHPDRFSGCRQVLSREDLTGRCYWEVEWTGLVSIAVSHKNISRTGTSDECEFGRNDKSWSLDCYNNSYEFSHNKISTSAPGPQSSRVGVYLDHRAGVLSFYCVSGTMMTLLHRVQTSFTQTLYAGFRLTWISGSTVELCELK